MRITVKASLNTASVEAKLKAWEASAAGKAMMDKKIDEYIEGDVRFTQAGSRVVTKGLLTEAAHELAGNITASAPGQISFGVSVGGAVKTGGGAMQLAMSITGDLARPSLYPAKYGGTPNIVVLFEKGYSASGKVWGYWNGDYTWSLQHREGEFFIHDAVDAFNASYGGLGITASIQGEYA